MIPTFPHFKKVEPSDSKIVDKFTLNFPYYSDFNFSSLWAWDISEQREISLLNENLVVKFTDYETGEIVLSFLGFNMANETAHTLLEYAITQGIKPELKYLPEISSFHLDTETFNVQRDVDNFDYVYLTSKISTMAGKEYETKRKLAASFEKNCPMGTLQILDLRTKSAQETILFMNRHWNEKRNIQEDDQSIVHERQAIERMFTLAEIRPLLCGILMNGDDPLGFTIEEIINNVMSIGHFWKTKGDVKGEYEFLAREMAKYLHERDVLYWNWEQDLGIASLRQSKSSYRPSDFLKKYTVTRI